MELAHIDYFRRTMYTLGLESRGRIGEVAGSIELKEIPRPGLQIPEGSAKISMRKGGHFEQLAISS